VVHSPTRARRNVTVGPEPSADEDDSLMGAVRRRRTIWRRRRRGSRLVSCRSLLVDVAITCKNVS
ncbi:MAG: hypothetical protein ACRDX8_14355, partial [Acidimicrobiales bacterium]